MTSPAQSEATDSGGRAPAGLRWGLPLAALGILVAHLSRFSPLQAPVTTDIRYFLYFAWRLAEGDTPYLHFFDPKTPLASFLGALFWSIGEGFGFDPIVAVRIGYLGLAAGCGLLCCITFRWLGNGRAVCALLGLAASVSFGLLAELPSIGNVPKGFMAFAAWSTALLCFRQRWVAAGAMGTLSFLDWQLGVLAWLGAFATAVLYGKPASRAVLRIVLGGALAMLPFVAFFAARGALVEAYDQAIVSAFFRGATTGEHTGFVDRVGNIVEVLSKQAGAPAWLCVVSLAGCAVVLYWLWHRRSEPTAPLLLPLAIYHFGILFFSFVDFQFRGDAFALLHSLVFFLAALWVALYLGFETWAGGRAPGIRSIGMIAFPILAFVVARPGPLYTPTQWYQSLPTLSEQREVATQLETLMAGRELVGVESSELLLLLRKPNPLPIIYWNAASWGHYCDVEAESAPACLSRLLDTTNTDVRLLYPRPGWTTMPENFRLYGLSNENKPGPEWTPVMLQSRAGRYTVLVHVRAD